MNKSTGSSTKLPTPQREILLKTLKARFEKHEDRHVGIAWATVEAKLEANPQALWSLWQMEETGGEPDVIGKEKDGILFCDCSPQSPEGRRSCCFDGLALRSRKEHKPKHSATETAEAMGIELLSEEAYRRLQALGEFDTTTSSWVQTPPAIRRLGGALFCDRRYGTVFTYHNGAESYYAARGFRGMLKV